MKSVSQALSRLDRVALTSVHAERSKEPLVYLARKMSSDIDALLGSGKKISPQQASDVGGLVNGATLAEYRSGSISSAREICESFVSHALDRFDQDADPRWLSAAFQPYVNTGRLLALDGRLHGALHVFRNSLAFCRGKEDWSLLSRKVGKEHADALRDASPELLAVATNIYASDSIRAALISEDWDELEKIVVELESEGDLQFASRVALEGRIRLLKERRAYKEALQVCRQLWSLCKKKAIPNIAVLSLAADIYVDAGEIQSAGELLQKLTQYGRKIEQTCPDHETLQRTYYRMAQTLLDLGHLEEGGALAAKAMRIAKAQRAPAIWIRLRCLALEAGIPEQDLAAQAPSQELLEAEQILPYHSEQVVCAIFKTLHPNLPTPFAYRNETVSARLSMGAVDDFKIKSLIAIGDSFISRDGSPGAVSADRKSPLHRQTVRLFSERL